MRLQRAKEPNSGVAELPISAGADWHLHYVKGIASAPYTPGEINIAFNVARYEQTLLFGQFYVMNPGRGVRLEDLPSAPESL